MSKKWRFPPFAATREGGYVYGRGAIDDKDNVTAGLMVMLMLKRLNVPLDRDVIFLAEAGEEGTTQVGIQFMVNEHYPEIEAEYCFAEACHHSAGGGAQVKFASVQTLEKISRPIALTARGPSGHGSCRSRGTQSRPVRRRRGGGRVAATSPPQRDDSGLLQAVGECLLGRRGRTLIAMCLKEVPNRRRRWNTSLSTSRATPRCSEPHYRRTSNGGHRTNVIPSEARATFDVRLVPDENPVELLELV